MSKSVKRVQAALDAAGADATIVAMQNGTRTAEAAAAAVGCTVDQIAKSIIFRGNDSDEVLLFITAGGNRVDPDRASAVAGQALLSADASFVRAKTGFVIGGVSPIGHLSAPRAYFDPKLLTFDVIWAAAGTPNHVFSIDPSSLLKISESQVSDFTT